MSLCTVMSQRHLTVVSATSIFSLPEIHLEKETIRPTVTPDPGNAPLTVTTFSMTTLTHTHLIMENLFSVLLLLKIKWVIYFSVQRTVHPEGGVCSSDLTRKVEPSRLSLSGRRSLLVWHLEAESPFSDLIREAESFLPASSGRQRLLVWHLDGVCVFWHHWGGGVSSSDIIREAESAFCDIIRGAKIIGRRSLFVWHHPEGGVNCRTNKGSRCFIFFFREETAAESEIIVYQQTLMSVSTDGQMMQ